MGQFKFAQPVFEEVLVEDNLKDGYWLDAVDIDGDGRPDLIASGLAEGEVVWYQNRIPEVDQAQHRLRFRSRSRWIMRRSPTDAPTSRSATTTEPACSAASRRTERSPGCSIPGGDGSGPWQRHYIADLVATHRMRFGSFTKPGARELMALPVVGPQGGPEAVHAPVQVMLYTPPAGGQAHRPMAGLGGRRQELPHHP